MIETSTRILIDILITVPTLWVHISVVEVGSNWVLMCALVKVYIATTIIRNTMQELAMITMKL